MNKEEAKYLYDRKVSRLKCREEEGKEVPKIVKKREKSPK
jgi:hypothetical protein